MIPILLSGTTVKGFLQEAISCSVTEERNGIYELTMEYPVTGQMFSEIAVDRLLKAKPNDTADLQLFKIYEITKPINGIVTINAEHISYALSHYPVKNVTASGNAAIVIQAILDNANINLSKNHGFSVATTTDMTSTNTFSYLVGSARSALGGSEGSVLDVFGGEFEFDNYVIRLHKNRGKDTGVLVAYGKNLTDVKVTTSMESSYTHLFPYCLKDDVLTTTSRIAVTNNSGIAERVLIKDFTSFFENEEEITASAITTKARAWLSQNDINAPSVNVSVSFIHLWQSSEYADVAVLEKVSLCDYVTVRHPQLAVDVKAQVTKTVYDVLAERYEKIELGSAKANFADTMKQATSKLQEAIQLMKKADNTSAITAAYTAAIEAATKAITGNSGGYVLLNPENNPQEILIMNTANKNTATKMWRWNLSGLGYSSNGYSGPFKTAITMNGAIVADFITTGTLTANIIKAGVLSSADGTSYFNLESGLIHTANAEIVGGSISIGGEKYKTVISDGWVRQHLSSATSEVGGLIPISLDSSNHFQCIYCSKSSTAKGVTIGYEASDGSIIALGEFLKGSINFRKKTSFYYDIVTNETAGNIFAAVTHYRTTDFGGKGNYTAIATFGCGVAHSKPSAALQLQNYGYSTITARLDVYASEGEAMICLRGNRDSSYSNELELGKNIWFSGEMNAKKFNVSSTEEIKENIRDVDTALDVIKNASVFRYNLIPDEPITEETDEQSAVIHTCSAGVSEVIIIGDENIPINTASPDAESETVTKDSIGFVIGEDTPDILLSEDKKHIDLYTVVALNWKATQEILSRLETLEGGKPNGRKNS